MTAATAEYQGGVPLRRLPPLSAWAAVAAALGLVVGAVMLTDAYHWRRGAQLILGGALGITLYHAGFGFTAAWRRLVTQRRGAGLRAQMLMMAVAVSLFFPVLAEGSLFGQRVVGFVMPVGVSAAIGAFGFGLGMQLAGGCASGTLYTAGGGNLRMLAVLASFIAGSVLATAHLPWWETLPSLGAHSLIAHAGWPAALAGCLGVFAAVAALSWWLEVRRHGAVERAALSPRHGTRRALQGPWPLLIAAILLALLNFATLALAGRPWGITSAFALWGAQALDAAGVPVRDWSYWQGQQARIDGSLFADVTSVMDFGLVLGAMLAAGLAGRFAPSLRIPLRSLAAAVIGGLLMGYGARLSYGCNIGAFFSGIASGSLHGWLWMVAAFVGSAVGVRLRPRFGI